MERFDFDIEKAAGAIISQKAKRVLLQLPEGIKKEALWIAGELKKKTGAEIIVSGERCWGGCDIDINEAKAAGAGLIVHYGHAPFFKAELPVCYCELRDKTDAMPLVRKSLQQLKQYKRIAVASSIQHISYLQKAKEFFEGNGKEVFVPKQKSHSFCSGHITGCDYGGLKEIKEGIDAIIVIGNQFHALGAGLSATSKPVFLVDAYNNTVEEISPLRNKIIKQRALAIQKIKDAKSVGIVVCLKEGQKFGNAETIRKALEEKGKETVIITMREFTPDKIYDFYSIGGFVGLGCPRIAIDDFGKYKKPIITFKEAMVAAEKKSWEELLREGFL